MNRYYFDYDLKLAYPSVTTILDIITEFGLKNWYKNTDKEEIEFISNFESHTGTMCHKWIHGYVKRDLKDQKPFIKANVPERYKIAIQNFLNWVADNDIRWVRSEVFVMCKDYQYGGTIYRERNSFT